MHYFLIIQLKYGISKSKYMNFSFHICLDNFLQLFYNYLCNIAGKHIYGS